MKLILRAALFSSLLLALAPEPAHAEGSTGGGAFGAGIILGDPTGFTFKGRFGAGSAFQLHLGFGLGEANGGHVTLVLDYLFHFLNAIPPAGNAGVLVPYLGFGGKLGVYDNDNRGHDGGALFGVLMPLGMAFFFRPVPVEVFFELGVGIHVIPATSSLIDGGIGVRYYF